METVKPQPNSTNMKFAYSSLENAKFKEGRRSWIRYQDMGVRDATQGEMSVEIMHINEAKGSRPTGWHYHTSAMQFNYIIEGWVKFEFPEMGVVTVKAGESIFIPGGMVHQELCSSEPMRLLEVFSPAAFRTVNVEAPAGGVEKASEYGVVEPVRNETDS